jgi:hypothetical protein
MPNLNMLPMASTKTPVGVSMFQLSPGREELERSTMTAVFGTSATNAQDQDQIAVGIYLGRYAPTVSYNRLLLIAESAEFEKENIDVRHAHEPLF